MNDVSSGKNKLWQPSATNNLSIISKKAVADIHNKVWRPPTVTVKFSEENREYLDTKLPALLFAPMKIRWA